MTCKGERQSSLDAQLLTLAYGARGMRCALLRLACVLVFMLGFALNSTIVLVTSEFGRTPKINASAGRDHYPRVYSLAVAGGGFKKGLIYGSSNSTAKRSTLTWM